MAYQPHNDQAGLEVYEDHASHAPEVSPQTQYTQVSKDPPGYGQVVPPKKGPFGLSTLALCALVAVITAVVIGAGVGGGLGAALASCKDSESSCLDRAAAATTSSCPTSTPTSSKDDEDNAEFYDPKLPEDVKNLTMPDACKKLGGTDEYTTPTGYIFKIRCSFDYPGNDIAPIIAYTAYDCMHACGLYTEANKDRKDAPECNSIAFDQQMAVQWEIRKANCWLKTGTKERFPDSDHLHTFLYAERT
ncbi:hypothetical protein FSARC_214 [Fusarium sarcochroum]|uniref:Uncharacterized protein n=1 Tax=Fusarium sarcochroum TaxID=1208366 RepID=A0A8H4XFQ7_9HYPO|nr:hypothetical protein FSARC_214 [Fusarium sarcochroum]